MKIYITGKIEKETTMKNKVHVQTKKDRKNTAKQILKNKVMENVNNTKFFSGIKGVSKIVSIIPLTGNIDPVEILKRILNGLGLEDNVEIKDPGLTTVYAERFKQNFTFVIPNLDNFFSVLDAAKVSDFVIFGISATEEVGPIGESFIRSIESQGVSTVFSVINDLEDVDGAKKQSDVKESLLSYIQHFFPTIEKLYALHQQADSLNLARGLSQKQPKGISWRDDRPYIVSDKVSWEENGDKGGLFVVEGTVRGKGLNPNRLVHIPGHGDFQIEKIVKLPKSSNKNNNKSMEIDEDSNNEVVAADEEEQEDLLEVAPYDEEMEEANEEELENGFPEEEEELGVKLDNHTYFRNEYLEEIEQKAKRRVLPKFISEHQARWILDDEMLEDMAELSNFDKDPTGKQNTEEEEMAIDEEDDEQNKMEEDEDLQTKYEPTEYGDDDEAFVDLPAEDEEKQLKEFRKLAQENLQFPDEIELEPTISAKDRLRRYRGIKSLRGCHWEVDEKDDRAPEHWKRLLRVSNFRATKNRLMKEFNEQVKVEVGSLVKIYIRIDKDGDEEKYNNIVERLAKSAETLPFFTVYGLLQHEHKLAVVNFTIQQSSDYEKPIAAKETLIAQCGFRRFVIRPVFSQSGKTPNNVYKYHRFMYPGDTVTATVIAPITFGSVATLMFKPRGTSINSKRLDLVATGTVLNADHSRVLTKRSVLTGHPFKIHKKVVTIRYMFFNREDILWFKAVPLFTRMGNSGYIKEALGTHGYFKATFDRKINPQDTVGMALYKRVWPRVASLYEY